MEFVQFLEPWMIPIVIMICVTLIVIVTSVTKIITTSMKEKNRSGDLSSNQEFLNALREFKENIDSRVRNLEEIATAELPSEQRSKSRQNRGNQQQSAIELELDDSKSKEEKGNRSSNLKNMLNQ